MKFPAVYLAGPMTGIPEYNYPRFDEVARRVRRIGHPVLNPAEALMADKALPYRVYMRSAIHLLLQAECILLLEGWEDSRGANMEVLLAQRLDLPIYVWSDIPDPIWGNMVREPLPQLAIAPAVHAPNYQVQTPPI